MNIFTRKISNPTYITIIYTQSTTRQTTKHSTPIFYTLSLKLIITIQGNNQKYAQQLQSTQQQTRFLQAFSKIKKKKKKKKKEKKKENKKKKKKKKMKNKKKKEKGK
eukprot:TRINITY_DN552_c0_g1_i3.p2 TRINITY_DN552_c0_g1~~TRINITY_DN552_c0_g1_i3.p2  ORF type:complete len:107 (-),score=11.65 TRINITY_DN552_c0_g1_i3:97-417(-)